MKKGIPLVLFLLIAGIALYFFLNPIKLGVPTITPSTPNPPPSLAQSVPEKSPPAPASPNPAETSQAPTANLAVLAGKVVTDSSPIPKVPPEIALENVHTAVRQYGEMFGGNPVGTNPEITSQLNGNNPKHINFINPQAGMRVNAAGELVDAWGTPYFFHQLSGTVMELHSAGPDKIMWTSDDLVIK